MLHIHTFDLGEDFNGRSQTIQELLSLMETWESYLEDSGWEEGQINAWNSNYRGLQTFANTQLKYGKNRYVVCVYEARTKIGYLLGGVAFRRGRSSCPR